MKNVLKIILAVLEYASLLIVGYYGIKYAFVAGPIYFSNPAGTIIGIVVALFFIFYILRKEEVIKL